MFDVQLCETGSGGDLLLLNDDIAIIDDIGNQPYLAWFGGNVEDKWWANDLLIEDDESKFISGTEKSLDDNNLTSKGRYNIENIAKKDLDFFNDSAEIAVNVTIEELDIVIIKAKIITEVYNSDYEWNCENVIDTQIHQPPANAATDGLGNYFIDNELNYFTI